MKKKRKIIVLSLGGSVIIPDEIDIIFLEKFKKLILGFQNKYKFVVVCGGGSIARKYISGLKKARKNHKLQSLAGIAITRLNARFLSYFFGKNPDSGIPHNIKQVNNLIKKQDIVFCGGLQYHANETSDSTAAKIAKYFKTDFINITNVSGLYNKDPKKHKNAKLISKISWKDFNKMARKIKYKPGQNFVLDQHGAEIIMKNKIKIYIIGKNINNLSNLLNNKKFKGSVVFG